MYLKWVAANDILQIGNPWQIAQQRQSALQKQSRSSLTIETLDSFSGLLVLKPVMTCVVGLSTPQANYSSQRLKLVIFWEGTTCTTLYLNN